MSTADRRDGDSERFLTRWSRLKAQARTEPEVPAAPETAAPVNDGKRTATAPADDAPPLVPPVESLSLDSDYRPFFHPKIDESLRRAALKKLFQDPHFNVMDGLDVYIDDYSQSDPIPEAMLGQLEQARKILGWAREDAEARAAQAAREAVAVQSGAAQAQSADANRSSTSGGGVAGRAGDEQPKDSAAG
jgi:hypothetical protein